jgi:hypothetical protein
LFLEEGGVCLVDEEVQSEQKAVLLVYAENEFVFGGGRGLFG